MPPVTDPPAVSVVVPLHNRADAVARAVRSVQAQAFADLEIVVVDDGSTDDGGAVVEGLGEPRLRLLRQANAGPGAARNAGIAAARGRWVAFLDADDAWRPEKLAAQLGALARDPALVWAAGAYETVNPGGDVRHPADPLDDARFAGPEVIADALPLIAAARRYVWTGAVVARRDVLQELGGFDPALRTGEDLLLWVRLAARHPRLAYVRRPIADYVAYGPGSLTSGKLTGGHLDDVAVARHLLAEGRDLPPPRAAAVRAIARDLLESLAKDQFLAGRFATAREALVTARALGLGPVLPGLGLAVRLPARPTAALCRRALRLRGALRRKPGARAPGA